MRGDRREREGGRREKGGSILAAGVGSGRETEDKIVGGRSEEKREKRGGHTSTRASSIFLSRPFNTLATLAE